MNKLACLSGVAGLAVVAALARPGQAADHADSPTLATNRMADITDVYAWMTSTNLNLVMDVSPDDDGTLVFGPETLYVFHVTSKPGLGIAASGGTETQVICRFASNTRVACWVVRGTTTLDYAAGDPSTTGLTSALGKVRVFAGQRSDPFAFNRSGFNNAVTRLSTLLGIRARDAALCPNEIAANEAQAVRDLLAAGPATDAFLSANVMALVVQIDRSLVNVMNSDNTTNKVVAVWGSTHAAL